MAESVLIPLKDGDLEIGPWGFRATRRDEGTKVTIALERPGLWEDFLFMQEVIFKHRTSLLSVYDFDSEEDCLDFDKDIQLKGVSLAAYLLQYGCFDVEGINWSVDEDNLYTTLVEEGLALQCDLLMEACELRNPALINPLIDEVASKLLRAVKGGTLLERICEDDE